MARTTSAREARPASYYATPFWRARRKEHLSEWPACLVCGVKRKKGMQVHHCLGVALDPEAVELATLCWSDHKMVELICNRKGNFTWAMMLQVWRLSQYKLKAQRAAA